MRICGCIEQVQITSFAALAAAAAGPPAPASGEVAGGLQLKNVEDALVGDLGLLGDAEEVDHDAGRVEPHRLADRVGEHAREKGAGQLGAVNVGDIGAQHQRGLGADGRGLQVGRLADGQLDRVGAGRHEGGDRLGQVLDAGEKRGLVEEAVVDGDIEAPLGLRIEQAVETGGFHESGLGSRAGDNPGRGVVWTGRSITVRLAPGWQDRAL